MARKACATGLRRHTAVVAKIKYLCQHYHFGSAKLFTYLGRYHDIHDQLLERLSDAQTSRTEPSSGLSAAQEVGETVYDKQ